MIKVVGIKFLTGNRIYYFSPGKNQVKNGDNVIVETERGTQFGLAVTDIEEIEENKVFLPLKDVVRVATKADVKSNNKNIEDAKKALEYAKKLVEDEAVDMKLFEADYTFDRKKINF